MASMTVTNLQATPMNAFETYSGGGLGTTALTFAGGNRRDPLPHPFQHIVLGAAGSSTDEETLIVHQRDFRSYHIGFYSSCHSHEPGEEWNMLVQAGKITVSQTLSDGDVEDGTEAEY